MAPSSGIRTNLRSCFRQCPTSQYWATVFAECPPASGSGCRSGPKRVDWQEQKVAETLEDDSTPIEASSVGGEQPWRRLWSAKNAENVVNSELNVNEYKYYRSNIKIIEQIL